QLQVAVDDLGPKQLAGYGPLDPISQAAVARIQDDLTRLLKRVRAYLRQGLGRDLSARLARLDAFGASVQTLAALEEIIGRWRLVEYRPTLEMIVNRLEKPCFELAVFGRVNSGKSSLLNVGVGGHVAGIASSSGWCQRELAGGGACRSPSALRRGRRGNPPRAAAIARLVHAPGAGPRADPATRRPSRGRRRTVLIS